MKVSQAELFGAVAILLYIVFFAHSPPTAVRSALGNVYVAGTVFAVLAYITLWHNRTIGVLLTLAFLLTMTRVTEHLDAETPAATGTATTPPPATATATPPPPPPFRAPSTGTTMDAAGNIVNAGGTVVQAAGTPTSSGVTSSATTSAAPNKTTEPPLPPPGVPTAPATPPAAATPPAPVMSCNIESFAPF